MSTKGRSSEPQRRTPFHPSPMPWSSKPPNAKTASAAAAATATTVDNADDREATFDETDGALSHYGTFRVGAGNVDSNYEEPADDDNDRMETHYGGEVSDYRADEDLSNTTLVGRISQYTAPTPSGKVYSQTELAEAAFSSKDPLEINEIQIGNQIIGDLLDSWAIDPEYRDAFLVALEDHMGTDRRTLLKELHKHLKKGFEATASSYGPDWEAANIMRRSQVDSHPIVTFSQAVQNKTDKSFTNHFAQSTLEVYNKYIKDEIEKRGASLQKFE